MTTYVNAEGNRSNIETPLAQHRVAVREHVTNVDGCCTIGYVAGFLGHADLHERMVSDGLMQADGLPYQHYLDCGYFVAVEDDERQPEVLVTPWGQSWLLNRYDMTDAARTAHLAAKVVQ